MGLAMGDKIPKYDTYFYVARQARLTTLSTGQLFVKIEGKGVAFDIWNALKSCKS
jgi:hypothetical protein